MTRERLRPALILVAIGITLWLAQEARDRWGISLSVESVREWVAAFGWKAPAAYFGVLTFRPFLLLPSVIVLPVGGALFGAFLGTAVGGAGLTAAAIIQFGLARSVGRDTVRVAPGSSLAGIRKRIEAAGPLLVCLVTAHPTGPMTAFHWGAGLASVAFVPFILAVLAGALLRSFLFSFFGASFADPGSPRMWIASSVLLLCFLLPLLHPAVRRELFKGTSPDA